MRLAVALASLVLACGDDLASHGPPLATATDLVIVAHPPDDLLFMQPDLREVVERGGVTTVYLRAGLQADAGAVEAYSIAAGSRDWQCGLITIADQPAQHCRLTDKNISLVFLDDARLATLLRIVRVTDPEIVRTLDITGTHGDDDDDHPDAGHHAVVALATANRSVDLISYRGENIAAEPPNKPTPLYDASVAMLARYEACATGCAPCGTACTTIEEKHVDWLLRRYAIGTRRRAGGHLRAANQCLAIDLNMTSCANTPVWVLDGAGELRNGDACLAVGLGGALTVDRCLGGESLRWIVDDEGHVISAAGEVRCLTPRDGVARLEPCGADNNPRWELVPDTQLTDRAALGISATGRDVRLADLTGDPWADLCAIESDELWCAAGTGTGTFLPAQRIDAIAAPLAVEPKSLAIGDVDGDGHADACGRDADGVLCATAASGFQAVRWTPGFADARALPTTPASLTALDSDADGIADLCGVDTQGVACVTHGTELAGSLRSAWPAQDAIVFLADLDGDAQADWCAATDTGPACGIWSERATTLDGIPWGYASAGTVDITPATTATVATGDIDADGRADLCSLRDDRITCARSQGHGFGPRTTLAILPNQTTASALWLGDLDGDGRADPCVDTGTYIICARQP